MRNLFATVMLLFVAACSDPIIMIPGGALSGEATTPPADWSMLDSIDTIQVEFRPADPYSINIWAVGLGPDLYIATGADGTRWSPMAEQDPNVRVRIDGKLYELSATKVTTPADIHRVANAYGGKYELEGQDNWVMTGMIFRLDRR